MNGTILVTGATGFLGTQIVREILARTDFSVLALVRGETDEAAMRRASRAWWDWPELRAAAEQEAGGRVAVLRGDVAEPHLGLGKVAYDDLARRVSHIVHSAADLRLRGPLEELRRTNIDGTREVLALARAAHTDHGFTRLAHISTAYVAGRAKPEVAEDEFDVDPGDLSPYERSKWEGERLVREAWGEVPATILRPGMIVGDSRNGAIKTFNTVYAPLRLYLGGRLRFVPASASVRVNLVPVDYVAEATVRLTLDSRAAGLAFHLSAPRESLPTSGELTEAVRQWALESLGVRLPRLVYVPLPLPRGGGGSGRGALGMLRSLAPYLRDERQFLRANTDRLLGRYPLDWREFLPRLLEYAVNRGFFHRSERTVHEQVVFRLAGRSRRVTYHDIVGGKIETRSAGEVRREMLEAAAALRAMGIEKGDRVAWTSHNSTRVLSLDVAIGLLGAVSVPVYYTSPPAEIDGILADAQAKVFFVGTPGVLARIDELASPVPVVSLCCDTPEPLRRSILGWDDFLALGREPVAPQAPVSFDDPATLRYTSGTTGRPRGIPFHHGNVRYMAESIVSLMPWKARTRRVTMLSFLPMNHVVEGILTTYAPYYAPAPLDLYFLDDFRALPRALRQVRPTFFFSVPRFYEKLWQSVVDAPLVGRIACGRRSWLGDRVVGPLVLRRAGLDRCAQLLVGSAPARADVLAGLARLGIEVHNAYGLTEAPLATLSRVGRNRLGTVGEPLPETQIRIAPDGEILVRGPQVTPEALHGGASLGVRDGWLATGDLGRLDEAGHLVVSGRKKELIVTAYGKNVAPEKVEALLRCIPGVREAMLVGEGEPHCAALLWVGKEGLSVEGSAAVEQAIRRVNVDVSQPERVRAWVLLPHDLSIETGELTANLKLRRHVVAARRAEVIDALYGRGPLPAGACRLGRAEREA